MERIATMAGVARSTVYAIFGSRAGLFDAVGVELRERGGYERLVEASHDADAREALRGGIRAASEMLAASRDSYRTLHSMAKLDAEAVGGSVHRWEEERAAAMTRIAAQLDEQGLLRPGVERGGGQRRALGHHQLRELRPALHRARPAARHRRRAADRDRGAGAHDPLNVEVSSVAMSLFSGTNWFALNVAPWGRG